MNLTLNLILVVSGALALTFGISFYMREKNVGKIRGYIMCLSISSFLTCVGYALMAFSVNFTAAFIFRDIGLFGIELYPLCVLFLMASDRKLSDQKQRVLHNVFCSLSIIDFVVFGQPDTNTFLRNGSYMTYAANNLLRHWYHYGYMILLICVNLLMAAKWYKNMHYRREKRFVIIAVAANGILFLGGALDAVAGHFDFQSPSFFYCMGIAISFFIFWHAARKNSIFVISVQSMSEDIFDFINTAILVFDFDRRLNLCNPFATQLLQIKQKEALTPNQIFVMDEALQNQIFQDAEKGITKTYRLKTLTNDKSCQVICQAKWDEAKEPICLIMVVMDMTKEDILIREANAANKAKSIFLAQMSHEIRTPINAVLGMNEMILRESSETAIREYAGDIRSAGRHLLSLINSILDFSKIEDGKMELQPVVYDVTGLIKDLVNPIAPRAKEKGLNLKVEVDSRIPRILYGDDVRIRQVISNLLINAVKYTEKGSVTLSLRQLENHDGKTTLCMEVKDTGIGIRQEDKEKLFEGFRRLDENRNRGIEGTGLGISIVTRLLDMMGTSLSLESTYEEGSVFSFYLTQQIIKDEPVGDFEIGFHIPEEAKEKEKYIVVKNANILVVDDNKMNIKVVCNLMKRNGIVPDTALSGSEAIFCAKGKQYDMIFLDDMMPGMNGAQTLKKMRAKKLLPPHTVVIALTANAIAGAREEYLKAGFDDYLSKPIEVEKLERHLQNYLPSELKEPEAPKEKTPQKINYRMGRKFCMNEEAFYREMMQAFLQEASDKKLQLFLEQKDWKNYRITAHALKGNLLNLGAEQASERAKALETALKENNTAYVTEHHDEFLAQYKEVAGEIEEYLNRKYEN